MAPELSMYHNEIVREVQEEYLGGIGYSCRILMGGHSNTCLLLETENEAYVLRIKDIGMSVEIDKELYAMKEGMKAGISPKIFYITKDKKGILMEYIRGEHLCGETGREKIRELAKTLRLLHSTKKNPYVHETINETTLKVYEKIRDDDCIKDEVKEAINLMETYTEQVELESVQKVNIHGDLNARNILSTHDKIILIDWEYAGWEIPFFDLSYLSLRLCYNQDEETQLLNYYLEREPLERDLRIYYLTKKIHLTQICVFFHYFSLKYRTQNSGIKDSHPKDIMNCMKIWNTAEDVDDLEQLYYDTARASLIAAKHNSE